LPTGTTAVTQSPGNNTTALATTAFVTAAVPAFATSSQAIDASSTTVATSPNTVREMMMFPGYINAYGGGNVATSGAGATASYTFGSQRWHALCSPNSTIAGYAFYVFDYTTNSIGIAGMSRGVTAYGRNWSKNVWVSGRTVLGQFAEAASGYNGNANCTARIMLGGRNSTGTGGMVSAKNGIGWRVAGGGSVALVLTVSNGTTLTEVTSSFTPVLQQVFDWKIYSDGTGNVTLYINDSQVATTTGGPTTTLETNNYYCEISEQTASSTGPLGFSNFGTKIYWAP
jgi:hypothetical protein